MWSALGWPRAKAAAPTTDPKLAHAYLQEACDMLEKRQKHVMRLAQTCKEYALLQAKNPKMRHEALRWLKRMHAYEKEIDMLVNKRFNILETMHNMDIAAMNVQLLTTLTLASNAMRDLKVKIKIENVDEVMEQIREHVTENEEISSAISQNIADAVDDDELETELDELIMQNALEGEHRQSLASAQPKAPANAPLISVAAHEMALHPAAVAAAVAIPLSSSSPSTPAVAVATAVSASSSLSSLSVSSALSVSSDAPASSAPLLPSVPTDPVRAPMVEIPLDDDTALRRFKASLAQ